MFVPSTSFHTNSTLILGYTKFLVTLTQLTYKMLPSEAKRKLSKYVGYRTNCGRGIEVNYIGFPTIAGKSSWEGVKFSIALF